MKKKILTIGIVSMFLLTGLLVGNAVAEKTTQATKDPGNDLEVNLIVNTRNLGIPYAIHPQIINRGTETINGPITVTFTIKKGFFGWRTVDEKTIIAISEDENLKPGGILHLECWFPDPLVRTAFYVFKYELNYDDENLGNNIDSARFLILFRRIFKF